MCVELGDSYADASYYCMVDDTIRVAFLERFVANTRPELDARNSSQQTSTVQVIANKMNDPTFNSTSLVDDEIHDSFSEPTDLSKDVCMNVDVT